MSVINAIASWYLKKRLYQIEMFVKHPIETQLEVFHKLISTAQNTEWGVRYGYKDIHQIGQFQARVPINTYEGLFPEVERILKGEKNVLWPGEIKWFSKSSGTTNDKHKFIPVSLEAIEDCHFKGGKDMLAIYLDSRPESQLFSGRGLPIGGSHTVNKLNETSYYGDLSAVLIQNTPHVFNLFRATSKKVALIGDWENKIKTMAQNVVDINITSIAGIPTWTLTLLNEIVDLKRSENKQIMDIWPGLEVFFHGGVSIKPYKAQFKELIPSDQLRYFETYNASEGFFAMQDQSDREDMLLMLDYGIFYEFIPLENLNESHPKTLTIADVELNVNYAIVISTNSGLWRYILGDTVRFTSVSPPRILITGRTTQFINSAGEELVVDNAERALAFASEKTNARISDFTAGPLYSKNGVPGRHEWLIEFVIPPSDFDQFSRLLDIELQNLNGDYASKRNRDYGLLPPIVKHLPQGTFYKWMKMRNKLGGQNKVPRLCNSREYLDSMAEMLS